MKQRNFEKQIEKVEIEFTGNEDKLIQFLKDIIKEAMDVSQKVA